MRRARTSSRSAQGKEAIIVTELPYTVKKGGDGGLIQKIADLVHDKKIPEISDLRDESDRHGMRLVIELKRDAIPKVVLNKLYKHTPMQTTFGVNMVALVDGVPRTLSLREVHRRLRRAPARGHRPAHEARAAPRRSARAHPRGPADRARQPRRGHRADPRLARPRAARARAHRRASSSREIQATAILDLRLSQLTALEADEIKHEHADIARADQELRAILGDEARVLGHHQGGARARSPSASATSAAREITASEDEIDIEDLIADQQMVITITKTGYIKSLPLATYRQQHRGGVGVTGMDMKDGDYIEHLFVCSSHDFLLFFTNRGKVYRSKVYELPEASRTAKGRALVNVLPLREGERIQSVLSTRDFAEAQVPRLRDAQRHGQEDRVQRLQHADQGRRHHRDQHPRRRRARRRAARRRRRRDPHGLPRGPGGALRTRTTRARWAATPAACAG